MKHYLRYLALSAVLLFSQGCMTYALLEEVRPSERVLIPCSKISEEELQREGRAYTKYEDRDYYMVEKTRWQKSRDYAILSVGLPVAVAIDGAIIVGVVYLALNYEDDDTDWKGKKKTNYSDR